MFDVQKYPQAPKSTNQTNHFKKPTASLSTLPFPDQTILFISPKQLQYIAICVSFKYDCVNSYFPHTDELLMQYNQCKYIPYYYLFIISFNNYHKHRDSDEYVSFTLTHLIIGFQFYSIYISISYFNNSLLSAILFVQPC